MSDVVITTPEPDAGGEVPADIVQPIVDAAVDAALAVQQSESAVIVAEETEAQVEEIQQEVEAWQRGQTELWGVVSELRESLSVLQISVEGLALAQLSEPEPSQGGEPEVMEIVEAEAEPAAEEAEREQGAPLIIAVPKARPAQRRRAGWQIW